MQTPPSTDYLSKLAKNRQIIKENYAFITDTSQTYIFFWTPLLCFCPLICIIGIKTSRNDTVFSRISHCVICFGKKGLRKITRKIFLAVSEERLVEPQGGVGKPLVGLTRSGSRPNPRPRGGCVGRTSAASRPSFAHINPPNLNLAGRINLSIVGEATQQTVIYLHHRPVSSPSEATTSVASVGPEAWSPWESHSCPGSAATQGLLPCRRKEQKRDVSRDACFFFLDAHGRRVI